MVVWGPRDSYTHPGKQGSQGVGDSPRLFPRSPGPQSKWSGLHLAWTSTGSETRGLPGFFLSYLRFFLTAAL